MPELPEVETIARGLQPRIVDRVIVSIDVLENTTIQFDKRLVTEVITEYKISSVWRRAKVLIWDLASGYSLLFHLKMTGQIIYDPPNNGSKQHVVSSQQMINDKGKRKNEANKLRFSGGHPTKSMDIVSMLPDKSTRVVFHLDDGSAVYFNDQRKFGWVKLLPSAEVERDQFIGRLGPEHDDAESFTPKYLWSKLRNRITPIKAVLLDQTVVAGIGNIYADEALHLAKIHPARKASSLSKSETLGLFDAILVVLSDGIERGGTSFTNYVNVLGTRGDYLEHARVFRRDGLLCKECGTEIIKTRVAGRGTHLCPTCQLYTRKNV
jgi:formamidopyrimidine-DNA glycosylase